MMLRTCIALAIVALAAGCKSEGASDGAESDAIAGAEEAETMLETLRAHTQANEPDPILERWVTTKDLAGCKLEGGTESDLADKFDGRRYEAGKKQVPEFLEEYKGAKLVTDYVGQEEDPAVYNGKDMVGDDCAVASGARFSIYTTVDDDEDDVVGLDYWGFFVDGTWKIWGLDATTYDCDADYATNFGFCKKFGELE